MKKLIFLKFAKDTSVFFLLMCLTIGLIVWTLQAVNYFDFVTQDGHGLKTYFSVKHTLYLCHHRRCLVCDIFPVLVCLQMFSDLFDNYKVFKNVLM